LFAAQVAVLLPLCSHATWFQMTDSNIASDAGQPVVLGQNLKSQLTEFLQDAVHLVKLTLHNTGWSYSCSALCHEYLPHLQELDVSEAKLIPRHAADSILGHLTKSTSLTSLTLGPTFSASGDAVRGLLSALTQLRTFHMPSWVVGTEEEVDALLGAPSLTDLLVSALLLTRQACWLS
jgi:hypothetical protein